MTQTIDETRLEAFLGKVVEETGAAYNTMLVAVGDELGLYTALAGAGPLPSKELAARTGTAERYVREWCNAQAASGFLRYDAEAGTYELPPEQAAVLADENSPAGYRANLVSEWIPALEGVEARLHAGIGVADVGCGFGASTILLAEAYPNSTFVGYDYHDASIETARRRAADAGVSDRVRFEVASAADYPGTYDVVAFFDCLHDMGDPVAAARHVRESLAPDGTWMLFEPAAGDRVQDNLNPVGRLYYAISTMVCTPASLAQDGRMALGAQAGPARLGEVLRAAGFSRVREAARTPFNIVLEARP